MAPSHASAHQHAWQAVEQPSTDRRAAERWECGRCGRAFGTATSCCAHEEQCGGLTRC